MAKKINIRGRQYDLDDIADLTSIQKVLVSDNWPGTAAEGVQYFLSIQNMLGLQFKRHLAANFKSLMKTAVEEGDENGGKAQVSAAFGFTIDMTAIQVATIAAHKLGFSVKHETKGKPQTHDLSQGEFLDDNMEVVLNVVQFEKENAAPPEPEPEPEPAKDPAAGGDVTAENTPGDAPAKEKKKPRRSKKKD